MADYVWITGVQGFIGSALSKHLSQRGYRVGGIGSGSWSQHAAQEHGVDFFVNARLNISSLNVLMGKSKELPDAIFHFAGGSSVGLSILKPVEDFTNTVVSTSCLVEWLRHHAPNTHVFYTSSAAVYGSGYSGCILESDVTHPYSPYGCHKRMAEILLESYHDSFNLQYTTLRFFSVYGKRLYKQLIWDACNKLATKNKKILFGGSGDERRDWVYIDDLVAILYYAYVHKEDMPNIMNVGSSISTPISKIIGLIVEYWGENQNYAFSGVVREGDPKNLIADISLLKSFQIEPKTSLEAGLLKTVLWYKNYLK